MRKQINVDELKNIISEQIHQEIKKMRINESIASGVLRFGNEATQINSPQDLEAFLGKNVASTSEWFDTINPKITKGDYIIPVGYAPYGSLGDWAVIEFFKAYNPDNIEVEYAYNGGGAQFGFIFGEESFLDTEIETATDQYLAELQGQLVKDEIAEIARQYDIPVTPELENLLDEYFMERVGAEAIDYNPDEVNRMLHEEGFLNGNDTQNEAIVRKVYEGVIKKIGTIKEDTTHPKGFLGYLASLIDDEQTKFEEEVSPTGDFVDNTSWQEKEIPIDYQSAQGNKATGYIYISICVENEHILIKYNGSNITLNNGELLHGNGELDEDAVDGLSQILFNTYDIALAEN